MVKGIWQIGVIVRDIEKAVKNLQELFGLESVPEPSPVGRQLCDYDCGTVYKGDDKSLASCRNCCIQFDNIELEFIEPYGDEPSEWKTFLDEKGEGIHHLGLKVTDPKEAAEMFSSKGYELTQSGHWPEGEYRYYDTAGGIGFVIETLRFFENS